MPTAVSEDPFLRERHLLRGHTGIVYSVRFTPDGERLATLGSDIVLKLWDLQTGNEAISLTLPYASQQLDFVDGMSSGLSHIHKEKLGSGERAVMRVCVAWASRGWLRKQTAVNWPSHSARSYLSDSMSQRTSEANRRFPIIFVEPSLT